MTLRKIGAIVLFLAMPPILHAGTCDTFCTAKRIVKALYPKTVKPGWTAVVRGESDLRVDGSLTVFSMGLDPPPPWPKAESAKPRSEFSFHFEFFDEPGGSGLFQLMVMGSPGHDKWESFMKSVRDNPAWSDAEVIEKLRSAGARFGPDRKAALIEQIPLDRLAAVLGPVHLDGVEFRQSAQAARQDNPDSAELTWRVAFSTVRRGRKLHYVLSAEPFDGTVTGIIRLPQ